VVSASDANGPPDNQAAVHNGVFQRIRWADEGVRPYTFPGGRITRKSWYASNLQADK